jgi:hypothetical protein
MVEFYVIEHLQNALNRTIFVESKKITIFYSKKSLEYQKQEGHDGSEIAHLYRPPGLSQF